MVCKITRSSNHEAQVIVARLQWPSLNDLAANFLYFVYLHPHALTTEQSGQAMRRGLWGTGRSKFKAQVIARFYCAYIYIYIYICIYVYVYIFIYIYRKKQKIIIF